MNDGLDAPITEMIGVLQVYRGPFDLNNEDEIWYIGEI